MLKTRLDRIQRDIEELAKFTCVEGIGCTRFTYTKEFAGARDFIVAEMKAAGLDVDAFESYLKQGIKPSCLLVTSKT